LPSNVANYRRPPPKQVSETTQIHDTATLSPTLKVTERNLDAVGLASTKDDPCALAADKGYHSRKQPKVLEGGVCKTHIDEPEPASGYLRWHGDEAEPARGAACFSEPRRRGAFLRCPPLLGERRCFPSLSPHRLSRHGQFRKADAGETITRRGENSGKYDHGHEYNIDHPRRDISIRRVWLLWARTLVLSRGVS
jgi:hypothetical protein